MSHYARAREDGNGGKGKRKGKGYAWPQQMGKGMDQYNYSGGWGGKSPGNAVPFPGGGPQAFPGQFQQQQPAPADLLGSWADSLGNAVHVFSTDAYEMRLMATLTRPPRPDIHLCIRPTVAGGGWQCGNSILDPVWTSDKQLHWVTVDGRVSVWVRLMESDVSKDKPKDAAEADEPAAVSEEKATEQPTAPAQPEEAQVQPST